MNNLFTFRCDGDKYSPTAAKHVKHTTVRNLSDNYRLLLPAVTPLRVWGSQVNEVRQYAKRADTKWQPTVVT